jgi:DNA polymerase IV
LLRWLVLDLNSFFASCEQQEDPELRDQPLIVVPTMAETTCAIAASYPAKALGIKTGTLVHEARRLCPDLKLVQANHKLCGAGCAGGGGALESNSDWGIRALFRS